jgi:hypothetical protein
MTIVQVVIDIWFGVAVIWAVLLNVALLITLRINKRVSLLDLYAGTPGYLDMIYIRWRKDNGKPYKVVIVARVAALINAVLAGMAFAFTVNGNR